MREIHPLGIQVNLQSGVSNGVLVVRTLKDCATLIKKVVTRNLEFQVDKTPENSHLVLTETISKCVFRVMTNDQMLTNAFWNHYLE